jgi:hypothetical protein
MIRLDRDRMPVRFALVTTVASGLILTAILNVLRADIFDGAVLAWAALATGAVGVIPGLSVQRSCVSANAPQEHF